MLGAGERAGDRDLLTARQRAAHGHHVAVVGRLGARGQPHLDTALLPIKSIKDLAGKRIGVSAPGSSTDFFLKYLLNKNGVDPNSVGVIGIGLGALV